MKAFGLSHPGCREKNEDLNLIQPMEDGSLLLMVADGMGGEIAGEVAARIVKEKMAGLQLRPQDMRQELALAVQKANEAILAKVKENPKYEGMGTTVTAAWLCNGTIEWVHVGDSRLYVLHNGELNQVTVDETMVQFLLDEGEITLEEKQTHPLRYMLDQCVGCESCEPIIGRLQAHPGDIVLLTTDGLHDEMDIETMTLFLNASTDIETKARTLIQSALEAGGEDNITVVIAEV